MYSWLLAYDFYQHPLVAHTVKFSVEYLLLCSEIKLAICDCNKRLAAHDRTLQMGIGIVLISVVAILVVRFFWRELFEPTFEIAVQAGFIVVDKYMALTRHKPSRMPLSASAASTGGVMFT